LNASIQNPIRITTNLKEAPMGIIYGAFFARPRGNARGTRKIKDSFTVTNCG
jgi:hypothetical protein